MVTSANTNIHSYQPVETLNEQWNHWYNFPGVSGKGKTSSSKDLRSFPSKYSYLPLPNPRTSQPNPVAVIGIQGIKDDSEKDCIANNSKMK